MGGKKLESWVHLEPEVKQDRVVSMTYTIHDQKGLLVEERLKDDPVIFLVGHGQVLKSLENKIIGQASGYKGTFIFTPDEAHGEYKKELVVQMRRDQFPNAFELKTGMKFESVGPKGEPVPLHIVDIKGDDVLVDGNHPLAGEVLTFKVEILEIRSAGREEIMQSKVLSEEDPENQTLH